jgi:hypothetical protein
MNFKQQSKVTIVKDNLGNTIRISKNNAEYAHIRLTQEKVNISSNGWMQNKTISTLIHGKTEDLKNSGIGKMKNLPGNIYVIESHTPFSTSNPERNIKRAGVNGIPCCLDGEIIYRDTKYDATGTQEDVLIAHNNIEDIRNNIAKNNNEFETFTSLSTEPKKNKQIDLEDSIAEVESESEISISYPNEDEDQDDDYTNDENFDNEDFDDDNFDDKVEEEIVTEENNVFTL